MPQESDYSSNVQSRNVGTKIVKAAIKFIIKHKNASAEVIEKVAGKSISKKFLTHYTKICKALKPLLKWTELPSNAVYDAVFRALYNAGVSHKVATNVALAIKEGLSWFI